MQLFIFLFFFFLMDLCQIHKEPDNDINTNKRWNLMPLNMRIVISDLFYTNQTVSARDNPCHRTETVFLIQK